MNLAVIGSGGREHAICYKLKQSAKVKKLVYAASASCYGIPTKVPTKEKDKINTMYPYAFTKWQAEELIMHWVKIYNLPANSLRFFNAYGARCGNNISIFTNNDDAYETAITLHDKGININSIMIQNHNYDYMMQNKFSHLVIFLQKF